MFQLLPLPYEIPMVGEVEKIFTTYGFVQTHDGRRFFFHFGTCASKPELLKVGDVVEFVIGEDMKTHRLHAQKVRKVKNIQAALQQSAAAPTAAILNGLAPAAVFVSAQTLLTVTTANLIPSYHHQQQQQAAVARFALANSMHNNVGQCCASVPSPSSSSCSTPSANISMQMVYHHHPVSTSVSPSMVLGAALKECAPAVSTANRIGAAKNENCNQNVVINSNTVKRVPLRPILSQQQQQQQQATSIGQFPKEYEMGKGDGSSLAWNSGLFKPFSAGVQETDMGAEKQSSQSMIKDPYERARNAWFSVSNGGVGEH